MKSGNVFIIGLLAALPSIGFTCEPPAVFHAPFAPRADAADTGDVAAFVTRSKPVVRHTSLSRGTAGDPAMCGGLGYISVELALPAGAPFAFGQVGAEVTLAEGRFYDHVFPEGPVTPGDPAMKTLQLSGVWYEGPPSGQQTLSAVFHAVFVAPDGKRGPPTRIVVKSKPKRTGKGEGVSP